MIGDPCNGTEGSVTQLVSGIVADAKELMKEQTALLRQELRGKVRHHALAAGTYLVVGLLLLSLAAILVCFTLVFLIAWAAPTLPLWACYALSPPPC